MKEVLEKIKSLGDIYYEYEFESCKNLLNEIPDYILSGDHENIVTKLSKQNWITTISKNILEQQKEYNYKINIIKSKSKLIMIGIAQIEPDLINKDFIQLIRSIPNSNSALKKRSLMYNLFKKIETCDLIFNYGWYLSLNNSSLFSDSPHNYRNKGINFIAKDEIKININMKEGTFNLLIDGDNKLQLYNNIPLEKPLSPAVLLFDEEDSIEIQPL